MKRAEYKRIGRGSAICCLGRWCATGAFRKWVKRDVAKRFRRARRMEGE